METFKVVRPEHLNHQGNLFGGDILRWVDEFAWIAATREFPGMRFVTVGIDRAEFRNPAPLGAVLRFNMALDHQGRTSLRYNAQVHAMPEGEQQEKLIFSTTVTFVRVDSEGNKVPLDS